MIFHAKKPNGFVMIDKAALNDNRISLKAKGLLCYLLSKPPDWRPQIEDICHRCKDRPSSIRSAFQELAKFGYAKLTKEAGENGRWEGSFWSIFEQPSPAEIAVSRISEKRNLKVLRIRGNKNERIISEIHPEPIEGWTKPSDESLTAESNEIIDEVFSGPQDKPFIPQWKKRAALTPWRTNLALAYLTDELTLGKIKNRGGRANWWYLNCHKPLKALFTNGINKS